MVALAALVLFLLFRLIGDIERAEQEEQHQRGLRDHSREKAAAIVHGVPPGFVESGRIGSSWRNESSMMNFWPICGITSPIVSR